MSWQEERLRVDEPNNGVQPTRHRAADPWRKVVLCMDNSMESSVRKRLILRPVIIAAIMLVVALFIVWFIPHLLSKANSLVGATEQQVSFPPIFGLMVVLALTFKPLSLLASNLFLLRDWKAGRAPSCPACSYPMIQCLAKRGEYAGQKFWGCSLYPRCGGKIHIG